MRRIFRPTEAPRFLRSEIVGQEKSQVLAYLRRPAEERRQRRDGLNDDIFFDPALRRDVRDVFGGKCAFCETQADHEGLVAHFRPLRFAESGTFDLPTEENKDYYLWLAFEWRNLFFSCLTCAKTKGERFPTEGPRASFLATLDDILEQETPLLLDPTRDLPAKHLRFLWDGEVMPLTDRGLTTIQTFGLNRLDLVADRLLLFNHSLDLIIAGPSTRTFDTAEELLDVRRAHSGALENLLKRALSTWNLPTGPIKGSGNTFFRRFRDEWRIAPEEKLSQLRELLEETRQRDSTAMSRQPAFGPAPLVDYYSSPRILQHTREREVARIEISNFKAIEHLSFDLADHRSTRSGAPALMILGENSTGKSSALAAIALALVGTKEARKLREYLPALPRSQDTDRLDQLDGLSAEVNVDFHFSGERASFRYDPLYGVDGTPDPSTIVLGYGPRRFFDRKRRRHRPGAAARIRTLFDPSATIPYPEDWLRSQTGQRFDTVAAALRVVLALDDADDLIVNPDGLSVRANGRTTSINALSEGYRSVFAMTVDIFRELLEYWDNIERAQAVVLIDEIETHLHPRWKMQVMSSLRRVLPRVQFIVTTHDPLCLRGMDDGEVQVLQRDDNRRIHTLDNLPSVTGMTAEQLLTSDYFGLASTTDPWTEMSLAKIAGDRIWRSQRGEFEAVPANSTMELVHRLVIGHSPTEQIIQDALVQYLEMREARKSLGPALRAEAVETILRALTEGEG